MTLINCPKCNQKVQNNNAICPICGFTINKTKPNNTIKACSCCGAIIWNKTYIGYLKNYCPECNERNINHKLIELPILCDDFENKIYKIKRKSDWELNKYIKSIYRVEKEIFEEYIKNWSSLDISSETYKINMKHLYNQETIPMINSSKATSPEPQKSSFIPKCPTCQSPDINKISITSKAGSLFIWGILSQKIKKQWHCNNCGYEW